MLEISYRARITLNSGQVVELYAPRLDTVLEGVEDYEEFGISSVVVLKFVVLKCSEAVSDGKAS